MGERRESTSTMATEQFCLRWNDFHSNITSAFSEIRDDDDFLDVTLVCDGDIVRAHKLVLSACSPLFRIMLKKNSHPQPMIFLRGIRFPDMVAILNFMYHGEVNVNQEDLQQFLAAAEELRIKGLSQANTWPEAKSDTTNTNQVPKKKMNSGGSSHSTGQPPAKRPRPEDKSSPGVSPVSTPVSAKTPEPEDDDIISSHDPPQLSVKPEFSSKEMGLIAAIDEDRENHSNSNHGTPSGGNGSGGNGNNLLDSIAAVQNFAAFGQGFDQNAMAQQAQHSAYNSPQHLMSGIGGAASQMNSENNQGKGESPHDGINYGPPGVGGLPYEMHRLGGRTEDGLAHVVVMKTFRGWHCPHCSYISPSQKGNLKVHILNRHANPGESFACMFCGKQLSSRSSLQVHISQVHREQNKAKRMLEERMKISHLEERLKTEMVAGVLSGGALPHSPGGSSLSLTNSQLHALVQVPTSHAPSSGPASSSGSLPQSPGRPGAESPPCVSPVPALEYSGRPQPCFSPDPPEDHYQNRPPALQPIVSHAQGYSPKPGYTLTRAPDGQSSYDKPVIYSQGGGGGGGELTIRRAGPYSPPPGNARSFSPPPGNARSYSPPPPERSYSPGAPSEATHAHVVYPMSPKDFQEGLSSSTCQAGSD